MHWLRGSQLQNIMSVDGSANLLGDINARGFWVNYLNYFECLRISQALKKPLFFRLMNSMFRFFFFKETKIIFTIIKKIKETT